MVDRALRCALVALVSCVCALSSSASLAHAGTANAGLKGAWKHNPIGGIKWGIYTGPIDGLWPAYAAARGANKTAIGRVARWPRSTWVGWWGDPTSTVREIIADTAHGDPNVLTQISTFQLPHWEGCGLHNSASFNRRFTDGLVSGIGTARVAVILQIDLAYGYCSPQAEKLIAYTAKRLSALPHTTVYLDAGADRWRPAAEQAHILEASGVAYARGFSVNDTQYGPTGAELQYARALDATLSADGFKHKHFLVSTDQNGTPYYAGGGGNYTPRCSRPGQTVCERLGIPPTTNVTSRRWGLSRGDAAIAGALCDGYVWAGRPWMINAGPFSLQYALNLGRRAPRYDYNPPPAP